MSTLNIEKVKISDLKVGDRVLIGVEERCVESIEHPFRVEITYNNSLTFYDNDVEIYRIVQDSPKRKCMDEKHMLDLKILRRDIDELIQIVDNRRTTAEGQGYPVYIRELSIVKTKLQEAKMWCGKCIEVLGFPLPEKYRDEYKHDDKA